MPNCTKYIGQYQSNVDCEIDTGRIVAVAFIRKEKEFVDISNPCEWLNLEYSSDVLIHKEVNGRYSKLSSTESDGKGNRDIKVTGRKHGAVILINSIKGNDPYWNILNKSSDYKLAFVVGDDYDLLYYTDKIITIDCGPIINKELDSEVNWEVIVKWSDILNPDVSDVPQGIFDPDESIPECAGFPYVFPYILS